MKDYANWISNHLTGSRTSDFPGGSIQPYPLRYWAPQFLCFNGFSEVICMSDPEKLALTSPMGGCRSVGIVRSRTRATELGS
jgi:hypothetical protein